MTSDDASPDYCFVWYRKRDAGAEHRYIRTYAGVGYRFRLWGLHAILISCREISMRPSRARI